MNTTNHPKRIIGEQEIIRLNMMRINQKDKVLTRVELRSILKTIAFPSNDTFIRCMCQGLNPIIEKIEKGVYRFPQSPIYFDRLKESWKKYQEYTSKMNKKGKIKEQVESEPTKCTNDETQCINYLKALGYRIYRQKPIEYEEL